MGTESIENPPIHWDNKTIQEFGEKSAQELNFKNGDKVDTILVERIGASLLTRNKYTHGNYFVEIFGVKDWIVWLPNFWTFNNVCFARALGHYILHSKCGMFKEKFKIDDIGRKHQETNHFAAGFLLPAKEVIDFTDSGWSSAWISVNYKVYQPLVEARLKYLGNETKSPIIG